MNEDFDGKVAWVTGSASGLGRAAARRLAKRGARVVLVGLTAESLTSVQAEIGSERCHGVVADVRDEAAVARAVAEAMDRFGALHVALLCAGVEADQGPVHTAALQTYDRIFDVHVRGVVHCLKHVLGVIADDGCVVTVASTGGVVGFPGAPLYCAAKHAVVGLTKVAALDYAHRGVRVSCAAPSAMDTPMLARFLGETPGLRDQLGAAHPLGRIATADEVAEAAVWLASPSASYVTGHTLLVDGGYAAR